MWRTEKLLRLRGQAGEQECRNRIVRFEPLAPMVIGIPQVAFMREWLSLQVTRSGISRRLMLVLGVAPFIFDPGLHALIVFAQHALIAKDLVKRPGHNHGSIAPASRAFEEIDRVIVDLHSSFR